MKAIHLKLSPRWFWIIAIALHMVCLGKQLFFHTTYLQDSKEYLYAAKNIIQHNQLYAWDLNQEFDNIWLTKRPFLYPLILAAFKVLSFGHGHFFLFFLLFAQNVVSLVSLRIALRMARKLNPDLNFALALLFLLLTPAQAIYANMVMSEVWLGFILVLILYYLMKEKQSSRSIRHLAILIILGMSLKPVMIFLAFCLPVYCIVNFDLSKLLKPALNSLLPLIFLTGISFVNLERTGYFHYSSISNINLLKYNTYTLLMHEYGAEYADSAIDRIQYLAEARPDYNSEQQFIRYECGHIIGQHLPAYAYLHARGMLLCMLDPGRFDITQFFHLEHEKNLLYEINKKNNLKTVFSLFINPAGIYLLLIFAANLIKLWMVFRFIFSGKFSLRLKLTLLFIPLYIVFFTGPIGSSRFAVPYFPVIFILLLVFAGNKKAGEFTKTSGMKNEFI